MQLDAKVAIVTGAGNGLGAEYARGLAGAGAAVVVADIDADSAARTTAELTDGGARAIAATVDSTDEAAVAAMVAAATAAFGGVDVLVNNAGWRPFPAGHHYDHFSEELNAAEWLRILEVNIVGPLICARACRASMAARGGGAIVNQTSNAAYNTGAGPYGVSKLGLNGLTMYLAEELAPDGIRVNGIAPGVMTGRGDPKILEPVIAAQLIKRRGAPVDLVGTLVYLCSDASAFVTGQTIVVDGGQTRRI
jgi:NAD(P)-dependent dehydrogenase (short-subunit alcohol dehydrogenase family)